MTVSMKHPLFPSFLVLIFVSLCSTGAFAQEYVHTHTLTKHTDTVWSIAFKDNNTLISGSQDHTLRAWNVDTGEQRWGREVGSPVYAVAIPVHDPSFVAYGGADNEIRMRYTDDGNWRGSFDPGHDWVHALAFKPNSYILASGHSLSGAISIWDVRNKYDVRHVQMLRGHTDVVDSVAWSPDGQTLASAGRDSTLRLWDPNNSVNFAVLRGHTGIVNSLTWSPDGRRLASRDDDSVRIWDLDTERPLQVISRSRNPLETVTFHPDGQILAIGDYQEISLWNPNTGQHIATLTGPTDWVYSMVFSPDGRTLASGSVDGTVLLWELIPSADVNATVSVSPPSVPSPAIGESLTLSINIAGGENVAGYQATVVFDSTALRYVESANGDFLPAGAFFVTPVVSGNRVALAATSLSEESHGDGTLATMTFEVVAVKVSTLTLSDVVLSDSVGVGLRPAVENGEVVLPSQAQGTSVVLESQKIDDVGDGIFGWSKGNSNGVVEVGEQITFTVTLKNVGTVEAKNVKGTLSAKDKSIESIIVDGEVDYGNIGVGKVSPAPLLDIDRSFTFKIPSVLTTRDAIFTLTVTADNGGPWTIPITVPIINPANIDIEFPDNLISAEAFGTSSTYFTLTAKYPTLTGIPDAAVHYEDCTITLHIPKDTQPFIFPIQTRGEKTLDILQDISITVAGIAVPAVEFIELFAKLVSLIDNLANEKTLDLKIQLPKLLGSGPGQPDKEIDFVVLLKNEISSLASIDITITQNYRRGTGSTTYEVERKHTWNFDEGWAAPAARPLAFSDYPPFQLLPLEVQQYLLHQFSAFETAAAWQIPDKTIVEQNYPNPFNPETWIPYHLAHAADVVLTIYDIKGAMVRQLDLGHQDAGYYTDRMKAAYWDGRNVSGELVASGVYFYQLRAGEYTAVRRMVIVK